MLLALVAGAHPIGLGENQGHARCREPIFERRAALQGLLQRRQRESRVDGEKRTFWVRSFERRIALTALLPHAVAEHVQQIPRIIATGDPDHLALAGKGRQLPSLLNVPVQKDQKLCGVVSALVALHVNIARQQRQHVFARNFLADSSHAEK